MITYQTVIDCQDKSEKADMRFGRYNSLKSIADFEFDIDLMQINYYADADIVKEERFYCYESTSWYCSDEWVGFRVYYFDEQMVAISEQNARKSIPIFYWTSKEDYEKVRDYLLSFMPEKEEIEFDLIDENRIFYKSMEELNPYDQELKNIPTP